MITREQGLLLMKPFMKYIGGKSWLVEQLVPEIEATSPKLYIEPFVGGGSIALGLTPSIPKVLNDANGLMIDVWLCLQRIPGVLYDALAKLYARTEPDNAYTRALVYYEVRAEFNKMIAQPRTMWAERAARLLYLNARCFNGLWRVNRHGEFNASWGKYESPRLLEREELLDYSKQLAHSTIMLGDAVTCLTKTRAPIEGMAIYADPPYDGTFTGYTANGFDEQAQRTLAAILASMAVMGANIWASNADTPLIRELYAWADLEVVGERRSVNTDGAGRGAAPCLLIRNRR